MGGLRISFKCAFLTDNIILTAFFVKNAHIEDKIPKRQEYLTGYFCNIN